MPGEGNHGFLINHYNRNSTCIADPTIRYEMVVITGLEDTVIIEWFSMETTARKMVKKMCIRIENLKKNTFLFIQKLDRAGRPSAHTSPDSRTTDDFPPDLTPEDLAVAIAAAEDKESEVLTVE